MTRPSIKQYDLDTPREKQARNSIQNNRKNKKEQEEERSRQVNSTMWETGGQQEEAQGTNAEQ